MNLDIVINYIQVLHKTIFTDRFGFWVFEILFFTIFLYALWKDKIHIKIKKKLIKMKLKRGLFAHAVIIRSEENQKIIIASASAFTTFVLSVIFTIASYPKEGRLVFYLINLGIVIYLFFYSSWFTNKLLEWWTKFKQREY